MDIVVAHLQGTPQYTERTRAVKQQKA